MKMSFIGLLLVNLAIGFGILYLILYATIFVHEFGHFVFAKHNYKVLDFQIGEKYIWYDKVHKDVRFRLGILPSKGIINYMTIREKSVSKTSQVKRKIAVIQTILGGPLFSLLFALVGLGGYALFSSMFFLILIALNIYAGLHVFFPWTEDFKQMKMSLKS